MTKVRPWAISVVLMIMELVVPFRGLAQTTGCCVCAGSGCEANPICFDAVSSAGLCATLCGAQGTPSQRRRRRSVRCWGSRSGARA